MGLSISTIELHSLDLLTLPVWIVSPRIEELVFANTVTRELMQTPYFSLLHKNIFSTHTQNDLTMYLSDLGNHHDITGILTVCREGEAVAATCRLPVHSLPEPGDVILFEDIETPTPQGLKASRSADYQRKRQGSYTRFFQTDSAPMLLIDPSRDGLIADANFSALNFYGYSHDTMCQKHAWGISTLGRHTLPVMHGIAHLPGGHKPLHFVHELADGTSRRVQTYAGPIEIYGNKLMLCIIHDITGRKRLEQGLERAALRDTLTGLLSRRHFYQVTEPEQTHTMSLTQDYSLLLIDTDRFKSVNDLFDRLKGNEILCALARTLESCARKDDLIFRWGGEEFMLLLPRTSLDTALSLAKVIWVTMAKVTLPGPPRFTVNIGVARHEANKSIGELFKRIDDTLYKTRGGDGNRVLAAWCLRRSVTAFSVTLSAVLFCLCGFT